MTEQERALLQMQQAVDQMGKVLDSSIAPVVAGYYKTLCASGVQRTQAATLTRGVQEWWLGQLRDIKE